MQDVLRELRRDPTTGDWVAISTERSFRPPHLALPERPRVPAAECPFCPGHESATLPAIRTVERSGRWSVRVVPNKYPALVPSVQLSRRGVGPYDKISGVGAHEVIVESPNHDLDPWELDNTQLVEVFSVVQERLRDLTRDFRLRYITWYRNHRAGAGASQSHPHSQIVALPVVPHQVRTMVRACWDHIQRTERELFQDLVDADRDDGRRIVRDSEHVLTVCPWAPAVPFETWLVPTAPGPSFQDAPSETLEDLARSLRFLAGRMAHELDDPPHNVVLYTAPQQEAAPCFRWHLRVQPRLVPRGGLEMGTGTNLHSVPPEEAARVLRGD